jgi:uncharacterized alkaline shock family protein YloU
VERGATISSDILARYAADAARAVEGVASLVEGRVPGRRGGVRIAGEDADMRVEVNLAVEWGARIPEVSREVQRAVRECLVRMAAVEPAAVDVVVGDVAREQG